MLRAVEMAPTHSEVRIAGPSTKDWSPKLLLPLPPYQRPVAMTHIGSSTSLCRCAKYSGPRSGP
jgi:hypothetical protein